jgi:FkbM family methyltransferase
MAENHFEDRVVVERVAVGERAGTSPLVFAPHSLNSGGAFLGRQGESLPAGHETRHVRTVALDDYPLQRPVSFIKIDVEGAEPLVMSGGRRLLQEDHPIVLSELHPSQLQRVSGMSAAQFVGRLQALGYRCHELGAGVMGKELVNPPETGVTSVVFV